VCTRLSFPPHYKKEKEPGDKATSQLQGHKASC